MISMAFFFFFFKKKSLDPKTPMVLIEMIQVLKKQSLFEFFFLVKKLIFERNKVLQQKNYSRGVFFFKKCFGSKNSMVFFFKIFLFYWSGKILRKQSLLWKYFSFCEKQNLEQKEFNKRIDLKKKFPWVFILKRGFKAKNSMVFVEVIKVLWKASDVFEDLSVKTTISNKRNLKENWYKERKYPWVFLLKRRVLIQKSHGFIILVENMV